MNQKLEFEFIIKAQLTDFHNELFPFWRATNTILIGLLLMDESMVTDEYNSKCTKCIGSFEYDRVYAYADLYGS